jgi:predicted dehydrogenase
MPTRRFRRRIEDTPSMPKIGVSIIGLGPACLPHARSLLDLSDQVEVIWAATRSQQRADAFSEQFPFPVTTDLDQAIHDPRVSAVLVLTPPAAHLETAERCLAAGRHILVEKPLELTVARGEQLVAAGHRAGRQVGVMLQHRFRPASLRLRTLLEAGALGTVEAASMTVPWWRPQSYYDEPGRGTMARDGGGVLLTQAIHTLDLFRSLVGISAITAAEIRTTSLHRMETEDFACAMLRTANGAPGMLMTTTAFPPGHPERIEIVGGKGAATLSGGGLEVAYASGEREVLAAEGSTGSGANIMDFPHDAHREVLRNFFTACATGHGLVISAEEALASQKVVDAILAKARESRA